ncbi:MAG TPA: hypothetical protein VG273_07365 [Bryobacteraceae bacterium]|jgi:hypothetical protein|nr:hypothetical protein [Bryobacteraceae bacterium]
MLTWAITAFSVALSLAFWRGIVVPFDRMNQLSQDLDDPGYLKNHDYDDAPSLPAAVERIPNHPAAISAGSFV